MRFECIDCGRIEGHGDGPEPYLCDRCAERRVAAEVGDHSDGGES